MGADLTVEEVEDKEERENEEWGQKVKEGRKRLERIQWWTNEENGAGRGGGIENEEEDGEEVKEMASMRYITI